MAKWFGIAIKLLILAALIAIGVFIYQACAGSPFIERIDKTEPTMAAAPLRIPTQTRTYLAQQATKNDDGSVTMTRWYIRVDGTWEYHPEAFTISPLYNPRIQKR